MKNMRGKFTIIAVVFSTLLLMSSGAQASGFLGLDGHTSPAERQIGFVQQAIQWLGGAWTGLTSVFELSEETETPTPAPECTTNCGDVGPGIDPIG